MYAIITENDISEWADKTGQLYHFPSKYKKILQPGVSVIYYKGKMTSKEFKGVRKSAQPHYFGMARVGKILVDSNSKKHDLFAVIENYVEFRDAVFFKEGGQYLEPIPKSREKNYWWDGVRPISRETFDGIAELADLKLEEENCVVPVDDWFISAKEGSPKSVYSTVYERDPGLRDKAIKIHGTTCKACNFDFKKNMDNTQRVSSIFITRSH